MIARSELQKPPKSMSESEKEPDTLNVVLEQQHLSPLSIQASALVRSIDALSNIFWFSIGGTFLTIFFAGLTQLETNATTDYIYLGEYQVPKSILPLATLSFGLFIFWLTANRLNMLRNVIDNSSLPKAMVHEMFHLNPPVIHVFDANNVKPWAAFTGVSVLIFNWAVFLGNSIALTLSSALQQGASFATVNGTTLALYVVLTVVVIVYGSRSITPPLKSILNSLHNIEFRVGWQRHTAAGLITLLVVLVNVGDLVARPGGVESDFLGPTIANATDGETLFLNGVEIKLFGIDAVEADQVCQNKVGEDYNCGRAATLALQNIVQNQDVICLPFITISDRRIVGTCILVSEDKAIPMEASDFFGNNNPNNLSRMMVEYGHAIGIGYGKELYEAEQRQAQTLRDGIWQGSFTPPWTWRANNRERQK